MRYDLSFSFPFYVFGCKITLFLSFSQIFGKKYFKIKEIQLSQTLLVLEFRTQQFQFFNLSILQAQQLQFFNLSILQFYLQRPHGIKHGNDRYADVGKDGHPHCGNTKSSQ